VINIVAFIETYHDSNVLQTVEWDRMDLEKELLNQYIRLRKVYDDMIPVITYLHRIHLYHIDFTIFKFICKSNYHLISPLLVMFKYSRNTDKRFGSMGQYGKNSKRYSYQEVQYLQTHWRFKN
jgi:hypothetical protein